MGGRASSLGQAEATLLARAKLRERGCARLRWWYVPPLGKRAMADEKNKSTNARLEKSTLYQRYLAEREEVLRHKWLESERAGRDIGFERALMDWILNHRAKWRKSRPAAGE